MPANAALAAVAGVALSGVLGIAVIGGALSSPASTAGSGGGLRPGVVPAAYVSLVEQAGTVCAAFPAPFIAAQLRVESGFDPAAVSPAGAEGIAQFMPGTWAVWGRDYDGNGTSSPFDPGDAIPAQAAYDCALAGQMSTALAAGMVSGGLTDLALAAYNAGPGAVLAAGGIPKIPETQHYVAEIDALAAQDTDPGGGGGGTSAPGFAAAMVSVAGSYLGLPYVWGGGNTQGPTTGLAGVGAAGFDCSGLVLRAVFAASGGTLTLPHDSNVQARQGSLVEQGDGDSIDFTRLQPGDVIAFELDPGDGNGPDGQYSHIGIYVGDHTLLHASHPGVGGGVKLESLDESYWAHVWWTVRRYGTTGSGGGAPSGSAMPTGNLPGWTQVMADDFTVTALDRRWWGKPYHGAPGGTRSSWWLPSHVSVGGGQLRIRTSRDPAAPGDDWTSGGISTGSRLAQTYGLYALRMRADPASGIDVVALLWPSGHGWPPEIDFAENSGSRARLTATLHTPPGNVMTHRGIPFDLTGWHTYAVAWTPGSLVFTVDGSTWATITGPSVPAIPMEFDLQAENMCGQGTCAGPGTPAASTMDVDWAVAYSWNPS